MKHVIKGVGLSLIFAASSGVLAAIGHLIGLASWWWPIYWPALLFCIVGYPVLFLLDNTQIVNSIFGLIFPGGGASGIFGSILVTAFLVWASILSILSATGFLKALTIFSTGRGKQRRAG
jgi:hypothetical protein